ncbi:MAG: C45 family autoproteolytic acyltransferase/hydrolase [Candidatus ainarchaeum sp.]|nr:C45 family autoproteolytic acyltransferase/hydrolase [Candidatus ainarchaeum sp.]
MRIVPKREFKGTHYQHGMQSGSICAGEFDKFKICVEATKVNPKKLTGQISMFRNFFPEYLDFIKGLAEGANVDHEKLAYHILTKYADMGGCTIFGVKTAAGAFVGRNYDWVPEAKDVIEVYTSLFPEHLKRYSTISVTDMDVEQGGKNLLYHAPIDMINSEGLYIGVTYSFYSGQDGFGIPALQMRQLVAETCANVLEALKLFEKVPVSNPKNFFIADRFGNMAVVEHTGGGSTNFRIILPDRNGILGKTNHLLYPDFRSMDRNRVPKDSYPRYDAAKRMIKEELGMITLNVMGGIFSTPPVYVGSDESYPTIWTLLMDMERGIYRLQYGEPNERGERSKEPLKI